MKIFLLMLMMIMIHNSAFAYAHIWYDKMAGINALKNVVMFPIVGADGYSDWDLILQERLTKKVKGVGFSVLPTEVLDLYPNALTTDLAKAQVVKEMTEADAYLVCKIREKSVKKDWSPEKECYVEMEAYTEVTNGPRGDKRFDESTWTETFVVPGQYVYLKTLVLDYCLYNTNGEKILLLSNRTQGYQVSESQQFEELAKEFAEEFKDAKKNSGK